MSWRLKRNARKVNLDLQNAQKHGPYSGYTLRFGIQGHYLGHFGGAGKFRALVEAMAQPFRKKPPLVRDPERQEEVRVGAEL